SIHRQPRFIHFPYTTLFRTKDGKGGYEEPIVNSVIFRQNTEGLYAGIEWTNPPANVRAAFESHPKWKAFKDVPNEELAISTRIIDRKSTRLNSGHVKISYAV